jgi:hypothetical protein
LLQIYLRCSSVLKQGHLTNLQIYILRIKGTLGITVVYHSADALKTLAFIEFRAKKEQPFLIALS